jgi:hypothetical protein
MTYRVEIADQVDQEDREFDFEVRQLLWCAIDNAPHLVVGRVVPEKSGCDRKPQDCSLSQGVAMSLSRIERHQKPHQRTGDDPGDGQLH